MPYDSNGNASINRNRAVTGQTVQAAQVNTPFDDVQSMLSQVLLRSGVAPMTGSLNMNNFRITNAPEATDSTDLANLGQVNSAVGTVSKVRSGYISAGFNLSNSTSDLVNDVVFPEGVVASSGSTPVLMSHSAATVQLDVAYGTGNGGRFDAAIAIGTWHCFVISDGTNVSRGFSQSLNPTSQPNYPAGYTYYRRVGSVIRNSGGILRFYQNEDVFDLAAFILNRSTPDPISSSLLSVTVPSGLVLQPKIYLVQVQFSTGNSRTSIATPGYPLRAVNITTLATEVGSTNIDGMIFTNTNSQIQFEVVVSGGSQSLNEVSTFGWIDKRGKA